MTSKKPTTFLTLILAAALLVPGCSDPSLRSIDVDTSLLGSASHSSPSKELRAAYIEAVQSRVSDEYAAKGIGSIHYLNNPVQRFSLSVDSEGLMLVAEQQAWHLALRTLSVSCSGADVPMPKATIRAERNRVDMDRGGISEWYTNGPLGVEHGIVLNEAPACSGFKTIRLAAEGDVTPLLDDADGDNRGEAIRFVDAEGQTQLSYSDVFVRDVQGRSVPAWLSVHGGQPAIVIDDADAAYPLVVDPLIWVEQQKLVAANGKAGDNLGNAVAISGDTAVIGAFNDDQQATNAGAAYVFVRQAGVWTQEAKLVAADAAMNASFGQSVAISGTTLLIGAYNDDDKGLGSGSAYVFVRQGGVWNQQAKLVAADGAAFDSFGLSVTLDGDTAAIGAPYGDGAVVDSGTAYVFDRNGGTWTQRAKIAPSDGLAYDDFGASVTLASGTLLIGADSHDVNAMDSGAAYVYVGAANTWTLEAKIAPNDGAASDYFGWASALSGNTALIGAYGDDDKGADAGSAYVYVRNGGVWTQQAKLQANDGSTGDVYGVSVALSGDRAIVGATFDDTKGVNSGSAYVYQRNGVSWTETAKIVPNDGAATDWFTSSVSLSNDTALIGARNDDDKGVDSGSAYVLVLRNATGDVCATAAECATGFCVDGVCCDQACGGGDPNDCRACSVANGAVVDGICGTATVGTVCRAAAGPCDVVEACDGTNDTCPTDSKADVSVVCRAAAGPCDVVEACDGTNDACPADAKASKLVVCRAAAGPCDLVEACDGTNDACPMDAKADLSVVCRAATGPCDVVEACDGTNDTCPTDAKADVAVVCRAAAGPCDAVETCDGTNDTCPVDAKANTSVVCRAAAGPCDVVESCDGTNDTCPVDAKAKATVICRASAGICDVEEACDGTTDACPADVKASVSVVCRAAGGVCDVEETCDGTNDLCPKDTKADESVVCRERKHPCDAPETCNEGGNNCPVDVNELSGSPCPGGTCSNGTCVPMGMGGGGVGGQGGQAGEAGSGGSTSDPPAGCACDVTSSRTNSSALTIFAAIAAMVARRRAAALKSSPRVRGR